MPSTSIFLTGATGYIGGSVLERLRKHSKFATFHISVLVRDREKARKLQTIIGVNVIIGSYSDHDMLAELASQADVVFACADADDASAAVAILNGLRNRYKRTGIAPVLIHTSGTGVLMDHAEGMYATDTIYSDLDLAKLEALPRTQPHRIVDLTVVEADQQGYTRTYIILPSTIYGIASGRLVELGIQHAYSQQIPRLVKVSLDRGQGGIVGAGKNMWSNVHIDEVADLYMTVFDAVDSSDPPGHGRSGYYFAENGEHTMYEVGKAIAQALFDLGKGESGVPTTFSEDEIRKYFPEGSGTLGTNSRCRGQRCRQIGWKPVRNTLDMLASIRLEISYD